MHFHPHTPLKVKLVAKYFSKTCQNQLLSPIFNLVKFSLRSKNECVALVAFKLSEALNTCEWGV